MQVLFSYDHINMQCNYSKIKGTPFSWLYGKIMNSFQPYTFIAPIFMRFLVGLFFFKFQKYSGSK